MAKVNKPIKEPREYFVFGDTLGRVLYGPEDKNGRREIIGFVSDKHVEKLQHIIDSFNRKR